MGVIKEQPGLKSLVAYLFGVIGTAIAVGLALNAAYASFSWPLQLVVAAHGELSNWRQLAAVILAGLVPVSGYSRFSVRARSSGSDYPHAAEQ